MEVSRVSAWLFLAPWFLIYKSILQADKYVLSNYKLRDQENEYQVVCDPLDFSEMDSESDFPHLSKRAVIDFALCGISFSSDLVLTDL